jgi:negative regulator of sigma F NrsF-like protein
MKTDDLISMLSTNVDPVDGGQVVRTVSIAILVGTAAALGAMLFALGVRTDLSKVSTLTYLPLKLVFTMGTLVLTSIALTKLARPGGERTTPVALVALPFLMIMLLAATSLAAAPSSHWEPAGSSNPGPSWQIAGTGDYDGDGNSDILWQGNSGLPAIWLMDGLSATGGAILPNPGSEWHIIA